MSKRNADWWRHAGDVGDTIVVTLSKALGDTLALVTGVSATLRNTVTGAEQALTAVVSDSTNREVTVDLGSWLQSTATAGDFHWVSLDVTLTGGDTRTFPESLTARPVLGIV